MQEFDYIIIGGGIVGLSVAWSILETKSGVRIAVLDKEDGWPGIKPDGTVGSFTQVFTISREASKRNCVARETGG